ncbi:MAG: hypothetical protein RQ801_09730 [Spirochaetaceae bacterium]|nr:hypothetical protein [Spirochaetaceae bacterium]MDT8298567.1 hypothetical protein [Spirochaetaceae bacterium]
MRVTREKLLTEARYIRQTLGDLPEEEIILALREVLKYYAAHFGHDDLEKLLKESKDDSFCSEDGLKV